MDNKSVQTERDRILLNAILGSATGYVDANITTDSVYEYSDFFKSMWDLVETDAVPEAPVKYSVMNEWVAKNLVLASDRDHFAQISDRAYLLDMFNKGDRRASVFFESRTTQGDAQPCRYVFFLYQDRQTMDVHSLCVLYDLTEEQKRELKMQRLEKELELCRISNFTSQMQPHFLYNALGAIQEIMLEDPEYASELLGDFTVHLRSCIRSMVGDKPLPFDQELENVKAYANIEKMRFGDKLRIAYDIGTDDFSILPLSIQPIVENAIRHGIYGRGVTGGTVVLSTRETDDTFIVEVKDNGVGFDIGEYTRVLQVNPRKHTGLRNIRFRLESVMQGKLDIESQVGTGTTVTITLPK